MTVIPQRATNAQYFSLFTSQSVAPSLLRAHRPHQYNSPARQAAQPAGGRAGWRAGGLWRAVEGRVNRETPGRERERGCQLSLNINISR